MQAGVERLLRDEPDHGEPDVHFTYREDPRQRPRLTLRAQILRHWQLGLVALFFIMIVSVANQAGPALISYGIDHGMVHPDMSVVIAVALLYLLAIAITALAQRAMVKVTGRLAAWVMNDLRIDVFTHLQRLGLDFYTDEKAGVIMTRMTSDIENLQQLLQDGLAQFIVQGLTMVVIAVILLATNVELALITILMVVPLLTVMSIWFQRASERGYERVRDGIANVLADLSESLHGVRIVTAHNRQARNVVHHRNVVGDYRASQLLHRPDQRRLRARHPDARIPGSGGVAGHRWHHGAARVSQRRRPDRVLPLPEPLHDAHPVARPAVQRVSAGTGVPGQAALTFCGRPECARAGRSGGSPARSTARSASTT